jgi:PAS domain S-box-containing protein
MKTPAQDAKRIEALRNYEILDTPPQKAFDDLVKLAAQVCGVPMAAVSLVDSDRQWFKARLGIPLAQTSLDTSICAHGIVEDGDLFIVPDAIKDPRFQDMALVRNDPHIRFYTGARLADSEGHALGMLCVMDHSPRTLNGPQLDALRMLARQVVNQMEMHRELARHERSRDLLESRQKELKHSEHLYHSLVENVPLIILRKDAGGRITFANNALCRVLGRTYEELIGLTDFDLMPQDIAERFRTNDQRVLATGEIMETLEEIPISPARTMIFQLTTIPLFDAEENIVGVQVISKDFTEHHLLQTRLLEAQTDLEKKVRTRTAELEDALSSLKHMKHEASAWKERYELVINSAGLTVYDMDRLTGAVVWSKGASRLLGPGSGTPERTSNEWLELIHPDDRENVHDSIETAIIQGKSFEVQYRLRHNTEDYRWIKDRGFVVPDAEGRCLRVLGMMQDITQQKAAEDAIREQDRLLDQSQDAIMVRDLENHVLYWNQTAQNMYGWSVGEALGRPVQDLLLRGDLAHIPAAEAVALEKGEWSGEVKLYSKDGRELIINSRWTLLRDQDGRPHAFLVTHTDLTERKLLEAKFLRAQRLESVGALASGIAHDLNNIFTPILMSAQLLGNNLDDATRANMLGILNTSARRGSEMVKQVLTFARGSETGPCLVQLKHLLNELEKMMRDTFPRNIRIEKMLKPDIWLVRGDATQLYQVLINLCVNARDAMPNGGVLRMEASNVELTPSGDGNDRQGPHVCLLVSDTGSGMSPEVQAKIFEPFFTTKEIGKGTGLGLSTVMSLVKAHGGEIKAESQEGVGTRFRIHLPAEHAESSETAMVKRTPPMGHGELLLVIDDESAIREIIKTTLEASGYDVRLARDGSEGIALYAAMRERIALVLTDIAMPGMDGSATIRGLKKINPAVKVIALTGLMEPARLEQFSAEGIVLLAKPVSSDKLLVTIDEVLQLKLQRN